MQRVGAVDVFGVGVKRAKRCGGRHEHAHRVGVVVKAVNKAFAHVFVNHRVVGYVVHPLFVLRIGGQFAVEQQVCHFEEVGLFGKLFDGVAAVAQHASIAVKIRDGRFACSSRQKRGVVHAQFRVEFAQGRR